MMKYLLGPIKQILTLRDLPVAGAIADEQLEIIHDGGLLVQEGRISEVGSFRKMVNLYHGAVEVIECENDVVAVPGLIDSHTHICYAGSRAADYAQRVAGKSYQEIAAGGGGILDTVRATREATQAELEAGLMRRLDEHLRRGVTTCEVKSGYGLNVDHELKILEAIQNVNDSGRIDLIPTCLAAHVRPPEFLDNQSYIEYLNNELLPLVKSKGLANRVDIFIEENAFRRDEAEIYLKKALELGFSLTVHADQFSTLGSEVASIYNAVSADHLEASTEKEILRLLKSNVIATILPGASMGLGMNFASARKMLDAGLSVVIASDWNPGSAPMGDLLLQVAVIGAAEKLSTAETWAAITTRAAEALELTDRGRIQPGYLADLAIFPTSDYREVLYHQGMMKPTMVIKKGEILIQ